MLEIKQKKWIKNEQLRNEVDVIITGFVGRRKWESGQDRGKDAADHLSAGHSAPSSKPRQSGFRTALCISFRLESDLNQIEHLWRDLKKGFAPTLPINPDGA